MGTPLTPTVITDRNGRVTTVHKKLDKNAAAGKGLPAPSLSVREAGTPLNLPAAMNPSQAVEYIRTLPRAGELAIRQKDVALLDHETELPLLKAMLEEKVVPETALRIVLKYSNDQGKITPNRHNVFLMAPLANEVKNEVFVASKMFKVMNAMNGWDDDREPVKKITTREEMASFTALTRFTVAFEEDLNIIKHKGGWVGGKSITSSAVMNRHLKKLVMDRPEDNDAIIQYVSERGGMHPKNVKPVNELKHWLEDSRNNRAVSSGWL